MPPWHADGRHGDFINERRLTETQKALLTRWSENGAPEGDPADKTEPPSFDDIGWSIGTPDLIVELPEEQHIPADGYVDYRYVTLDPQIEQDRWVQAVEIRPTNRAATHHVLLILINQ